MRHLFLLILAALMGCEACDGDVGNDLSNLKPGRLRVAEAVLVFGPTPLQMSQKQEIQLYNSGQLPLVFESMAFEPEGVVFLIPNQPDRLDVKESLFMEVVFTPGEATAYAAQLIFTFDGDNSPFQLSVSGEGMANPLCAPCDETPASFCMNDQVMAFYEKTSETCDNGLCLYTVQDVSCNWGCAPEAGRCVVLDAGPGNNGSGNGNNNNNNPPPSPTDAGVIDAGTHGNGNNNPPLSGAIDSGPANLPDDAGVSPTYEVAHSNPTQCFNCTDWNNPTTCGAAAPGCPAPNSTGHGQEYHHNQLSPLQFTVVGSELLQDERTGLVWRRCLNGGAGTPCDANTLLQNFSQAQTTCNELQTDNGETMRMPSLGELLTITDYESTLGIFQNDFFDLPNASFWTATATEPDNPLTNYWVVNDIAQSLTSQNIQSQAHVLCVAGQPWGSNGFIENGNSITDTRTGLEWQTCPYGQSPGASAGCTGTIMLLPFHEALATCENLNLDQHTNWRLPTIRELSTLRLWPDENLTHAFGEAAQGLLGRLFSASVTTDRSAVWVFSPTEPYWQKGGQTHTFRCVRAP